MKPNEFNFIDPVVPQKLVELLMGPITDDDGIQISLTSEFKTMAHIMAKIGFFKSVGDARKNGWDKPIPPGFTSLTVGKAAKMKTIFILADSPVWHEKTLD